MVEVTNENYYYNTTQREYWSVSQFKAFDKCEAAAMADIKGEYRREETTALLVGSYVDAFFSGELEGFRDWHPEIYKRNSDELRAEYRHADEIIDRIEAQPVLMDYLTGNTQEIRTAELFGVPWKIKMDVYKPDERIVDLKVVKDFEDIYKEGFGRVSWIQYWGYDIQGAVYQKVEQLSSGRKKPLPFYIVAATKEKIPDVALIHIPQHILDAALKVVESKIDKFDLVKQGYIDPDRCGKCDFCKRTKVITSAMEFDIEEGGDN